MDCLYCQVTIECHDQLNHDIKELAEIQKHICNGHMVLAIELMDGFIAKMGKRNNKITGRG